MRVAYVVPYPLQGAVGQRVHLVARAMVRGEQVAAVDLIGPGSSLALVPDEPISFVPTRTSGRQGGSVITKVKRRLNRSADALAALNGLTSAPDVVIVYGGGSAYMGAVIRWARRRKVSVAADVVEWFDPSHQPLGRFGPYALDNHLMMTRTLRQVDGAIVISRFLQRHLESLGVERLVRVPPLAAVRTRVAAPQAHEGPLRLAYCGAPGKKDRLDLVIRALAAVDPEGRFVRLDIAGVDAQQLRELYGFEELPASVTAWGRVPHERSLEILAGADFMPLIRDNERFANAGFPTKVVEATSLGVTPWVNLTSDLGDFLVDGDNAVVVPGNNLEEVARSLEALSDFTAEEVAFLSLRATETADRFTVDSAVAKLDEWLSGLGAAGR